MARGGSEPGEESRGPGVSAPGAGLAFCFRGLCEGAVPHLWEPLGPKKKLQTDFLLAVVSHIQVTENLARLIDEIRSANKYLTIMKVIICNV